MSQNMKNYLPVSMFDLRRGRVSFARLQTERGDNHIKTNTFPFLWGICAKCCNVFPGPDCLYLTRGHLEHVGLWLCGHHECNNTTAAFLSLLSVSTQTGDVLSSLGTVQCANQFSRLEGKCSLMRRDKLGTSTWDIHRLELRSATQQGWETRMWDAGVGLQWWN